MTTGAPKVNFSLSHLTVERQVAGATQHQAVSAPVFLSREMLGHNLGWQEDLECANRLEAIRLAHNLRTDEGAYKRIHRGDRGFLAYGRLFILRWHTFDRVRPRAGRGDGFWRPADRGQK